MDNNYCRAKFRSKGANARANSRRVRNDLSKNKEINPARGIPRENANATRVKISKHAPIETESNAAEQ